MSTYWKDYTIDDKLEMMYRYLFRKGIDFDFTRKEIDIEITNDPNVLFIGVALDPEDELNAIITAAGHILFNQGKNQPNLSYLWNEKEIETLRADTMHVIFSEYFEISRSKEREEEITKCLGKVTRYDIEKYVYPTAVPAAEDIYILENIKKEIDQQKEKGVYEPLKWVLDSLHDYSIDHKLNVMHKYLEKNGIRVDYIADMLNIGIPIPDKNLILVSKRLSPEEELNAIITTAGHVLLNKTEEVNKLGIDNNPNKKEILKFRADTFYDQACNVLGIPKLEERAFKTSQYRKILPMGDMEKYVYPALKKSIGETTKITHQHYVLKDRRKRKKYLKRYLEYHNMKIAVKDRTEFVLENPDVFKNIQLKETKQKVKVNDTEYPVYVGANEMYQTVLNFWLDTGKYRVYKLKDYEIDESREPNVKSPEQATADDYEMEI